MAVVDREVDRKDLIIEAPSINKPVFTFCIHVQTMGSKTITIGIHHANLHMIM